MVRGRLVFTMAIGSMLMAITINEMSLIRIATWTISIRQLLDTMVTNGAVGMVQVTRTVLPKDHTRIHEIESDSECDSECSVMSDPKEHLEEEAEPTPVSSKN